MAYDEQAKMKKKKKRIKIKFKVESNKTEIILCALSIEYI